MSGPGEDNVAGAPRLEVQDERELGESALDMRLLLQQQQAWLAQQQQQQQAWIAQQQKQQQQMMEMMLGQLTKLAVGGRASAPARTAERAQPLAPECDGSEDVQAHSDGSLDSQRSLPPPELEPAFDPASRLDSLYRQKEVEAQQRWERRRMQPKQGQAHTSAREPEPPRAKMPTFEGKEEWDSFINPFERMARRNDWGPQQKLDRLHESLRGAAASFVYTQPEEVQEDYPQLCRELQHRFGRQDPPSTARQKLGELRQGKEAVEEYAERVRRLVSRAYPDVPLATQEELAAEAFLRGYKSPRVAYQAMNREPATLSAALTLVDTYEHNYKATVGRDLETPTRSRTRQVTWASEVEVGEVRRVATPTVTDKADLDARLEDLQSSFNRDLTELRSTMEGHFQSRLEGLEQRLGKLLKEAVGSREEPPVKPDREQGTCRSPRELSPVSPGRMLGGRRANNSKCYGCGEPGHFKRDCSRSPSPASRGSEN